MLHCHKPVSGLQLTFGSNLLCFSIFGAIRLAHFGSDYSRDSLNESMALHVNI